MLHFKHQVTDNYFDWSPIRHLLRCPLCKKSGRSLFFTENRCRIRRTGSVVELRVFCPHCRRIVELCAPVCCWPFFLRASGSGEAVEALVSFVSSFEARSSDYAVVSL